MFLDVLAWIVLILLPIIILYGIGKTIDEDTRKYYFTNTKPFFKTFFRRLLLGLLAIIVFINGVAIIFGIIILIEWSLTRVGLF